MSFIINSLRFASVVSPPAVTLLGSATWTTNSGTKTVTASATAGRLPVVITAASGSTASAAPTDDQGDGGTYSQISASVNGATTNLMTAWIRSKAWTNSASTVVTHAPGATTGGGLCVLEATNMTKVGATAIKQSKNIDNQSTARPSIVFDATPQSANPVIGAVWGGANPLGVSVRAGYTEHFSLGYATPAFGFEAMSINSGETSATIQWGSGVTGGAWGGIIVELDSSP